MVKSILSKKKNTSMGKFEVVCIKTTSFYKSKSYRPLFSVVNSFCPFAKTSFVLRSE